MKWFNKIRVFFFSLILIQAGLQAHAQKFAGVYKGSFSGDLSGTFEFTVDNIHYSNLEGSFRTSDGLVRVLYGRVDEKGVIDAFFYDKRTDVMSGIMYRGTFRGNMNGVQTAGSYEVFDATWEKSTTSKGSWSLKSNTPDAGLLTFTTRLGKDLPVDDPTPIALRIHLMLNDQYRNNYSIRAITIGNAIAVNGRYAAGKLPKENFYLYTDIDGVIVHPPAYSKEANYDLPYASYGSNGDLALPRSFKIELLVTLKSETGEPDREMKLEVPVEINAAANLKVKDCGFGECPSLNDKKIAKGQTAAVQTGDELMIPMEASVWVKFLDGSQSLLTNKSQTSWRIRIRAGHIVSSQAWAYTENAVSIQAIANKGIESGGEKMQEEGLQILMRKSASAASPGLIMQLSQFIGASQAGGELVAIKVRSKLDIMLYTDGSYRVRNLEGTPEIARKKGGPLKIPVGKQVMVDQKGLVSAPVTIPVRPVEPVVIKKPAIANWQGTWQTPWGVMNILQTDYSVTGTYVHDKGQIKGTINGNILTGDWSESPSYEAPKDAGSFEFVLSADGKSFTGRWRYGSSGNWQGGWDGHR